MSNNELTHYGILGMKWGIRRSEAQLARAKARRERRQPSEDHIRAKALKKKKLKALSNNELRELNNRMQLETQYKDLKKKNKSAGRKFVEEVARDAAKETAKEYTKKFTKKGLEYAATRVVSSGAVQSAKGRAEVAYAIAKNKKNKKNKKRAIRD